MSTKKSPPQKTTTATAIDAAVHGQSSTQIIARTERHELFEGPLPPPDLLKQYEQTLPGIAERIVRMAEEEQAHRHTLAQADLDRKAKLTAIADRESAASVAAMARGQKIGLCISGACIVFAFACAYMGLDKWIVGAFLAVPTASFISAFIPRKPSEEKTQP